MRFEVLVFLTACLAGTASGASEDVQSATWKSQKLSMNYAGFTSKYSCEGLRDSVSQVLTALGVRRDFTVSPYPCTRPGRPEPFPSADIEFASLQPAAANAGDTVKAVWKTVDVTAAAHLSAGDCELVDQIRHDVLPLLSTRNLVARTDCVPHQESSGRPTLTVDVLVPAAP
jgi:hypothetical protein